MDVLGPVLEAEDVRARPLEQLRGLAGAAPAVPEGADVVEDEDVQVPDRVEPAGQCLQQAGGVAVVAVEEQDVVARRALESRVARPAQPHVLGQVYGLDPRVAGGVLVDDLTAGVR